MNSRDIYNGAEMYRRWVNPARHALLQSSGGPLVFPEASGSWLTDAQGRRFLDLVCGYGTATLGHRHPAVMAELGIALAGGSAFTYPSSVSTAAGELARKLCGLAGRDLEKVYFGNSGSEGIEAALKFAMARTGKSKFLSFSEAFHGLTLGALSLTGSEYFKAPFSSFGVTARQVEFEDLNLLEHSLRDNSIAGVVVEPVQGMGGARPWDIEKLEQLSLLCRRYHVLLIVDEVLTGIGRTGKWFAFQHAGENFMPDIVVTSKGLTGGAVPMCAVLMTNEIFEAVYSGIGRANIHASTFEGNLLAMVVGLSVIRQIEENDLLSRICSLANAFRLGLTELQREGLGITEVRVSGLLIGFQTDDDLFRHDKLWGAAACKYHLLKRGVITSLAAQATSFINLTPAFTLSDCDASWFFRQLTHVLREGEQLKTVKE